MVFKVKRVGTSFSSKGIELSLLFVLVPDEARSEFFHLNFLLSEILDLGLGRRQLGTEFVCKRPSSISKVDQRENQLYILLTNILKIIKAI
jgi:hypothetical protein